jgi:hypothetical protein
MIQQPPQRFFVCKRVNKVFVYYKNEPTPVFTFERSAYGKPYLGYGLTFKSLSALTGYILKYGDVLMKARERISA